MTAPSLVPIATSLVLEAPQLQWSKWYSYLESYLQDGGGFALLGLCVWIVAAFVRSMNARGRRPGSGVPLIIFAVAIVSLVSYAVGATGSVIASYSLSREGATAMEAAVAKFNSRMRWWNAAMSFGGGLALLGVFVPFLRDNLTIRFRRVWALARLAFVEAVRRRILWVFLVFALLFLFPPKWFYPIKPEEEISANVVLVHQGTTPLLLLAAALLASFSIPTDIRNQTIHTIVTKPVQRFEIVMGRYFGFLGLMSLVMFGVFAFALAMIAMSRIDPEAQFESMKARVPVYGELGFVGPSKNFQGDSVGREWEYRKYIPGGLASPYRAMWYFHDRDLEPGLAKIPDAVNCEFSFDIFRTTKGEENKGVFCTFFMITHQANRKDVAKQYKELTQGLSPNASPTGTPGERQDWETLKRIVGELGYYEFHDKEIADYHTQSVPIPPTLFAKAMEGTPESVEVPEKGMQSGPRLIIAIRCDSENQYLGVAKADLYLLAQERSFYLNFFKGAFGLWLRLAIVIGIAVTCSTYLNGVVSFLATAFLALLGFFESFLTTNILAGFQRNLANPGPADSFRKLLSNESLGQAPDQSNPAHQVASALDEVFSWCLRRVFNVVPNLERLEWVEYVRKGFDVPMQEMSLSLIFVAGYLALWAVLAHYLMKWREVATW